MSALLLAAMLLQSSTYHDEPYNGAECDQAAADRGIQIEMNICAWREHEAEDDRLNATWNEAREFAKSKDTRYRDSAFFEKEDDGRYFANLLEQQRAWLKYRDTSCTIAADHYRNGSMRPMAYSACMAQMTKNRTAALRAYMEQEY